MLEDPVSEEQPQPWLKEALRAPEVQARCKPGNGGSVFSRLDETDLACLSHDELVTYWLESGADLEDLARLLRERPHLLHVELIRQQLFHLHALARGFMPAWDTLMGRKRDKENAARQWLKVIAHGVVRGLLPAASIGRPRTLHPHTLLKDLKKLLARLKHVVDQDPFVLMQKRTESQSEFVHRIAERIHGFYQSAHLSVRFTNSTDQPFLDDRGRRQWEQRALDYAGARTIAERVVGRHRTASGNTLIYGILRHHYQISPRALENHLARAKEQDPDLARSLLQQFPRYVRQS